MKNKLFKGLFGCLLALCLCVVTDVYAVDSETLGSVTEGSNSASQNVTIGEVETPVYEVVLIWQDLTFNWVYDENSQEFAWRKPAVCQYFTEDQEIAENAISRGEELYSDGECTSRAYINEVPSTYYVLKEYKTSTIGIEDLSQNGQIVPSVSWQSSEKYDHVIAELTYRVEESTCTMIESEGVLEAATELGVTLYSDSACSEPVIGYPTSLDDSYYVFINQDVERSVTGEIPDEARYSGAGASSEYNFTEAAYSFYPKQFYYISLGLENDPEKEAITPVAGDVLGTVTISIRAR